MEKKTLNIKGMSCQMCVKHVTKALEALDGVTKVKVSLESNSADVTFDPAAVSMANFKSAVTESGYEVAG